MIIGFKKFEIWVSNTKKFLGLKLTKKWVSNNNQQVGLNDSNKTLNRFINTRLIYKCLILNQCSIIKSLDQV